MFSRDDFLQLRFLEGQWQGTGPDGSHFYERYDFPESSEMRSRRFTDATFSSSTDSSTVSYQDGTIISRWGDFTWEAAEIGDGKACFSPVNAPSSFCWQRVSTDTVHVTQRWMDENGETQQYVVPLQRM